jgi:hypothetical protein
MTIIVKIYFTKFKISGTFRSKKKRKRRRRRRRKAVPINGCLKVETVGDSFWLGKCLIQLRENITR